MSDKKANGVKITNKPLFDIIEEENIEIEDKKEKEPLNGIEIDKKVDEQVDIDDKDNQIVVPKSAEKDVITIKIDAKKLKAIAYKIIMYMVVIVVISTACFVSYTTIVALIRQYNREPMKLYKSIPNAGCINIQSINLENDHYMNKNYELEELDYSMDYYIKYNDYDGICAVDFGIPICYCKLKTDTDGILGMFNMNITGYSLNAVLNEEYSHFCPEKDNIFAERRKKVWAEFNTRDGDSIEKLFKHDDAYILQHMYDVSTGISICESNSNNYQYNILISNGIQK